MSSSKRTSSNVSLGIDEEQEDFEGAVSCGRHESFFSNPVLP
jgi:hypothetical protein